MPYRHATAPRAWPALLLAGLCLVACGQPAAPQQSAANAALAAIPDDLGHPDAQLLRVTHRHTSLQEKPPCTP